ncbi:tyrosine-type recombinase/integrase [Rhizobium sp. 007]|uniref:tyrosine-type recombinase/integrase n=1 Tax=Rhizobium sp. 007 TaxID=2785056 RepID=UPI0032B13872
MITRLEIRKSRSARIGVVAVVQNNAYLFPNSAGGRISRSNVTQRLNLAVEVAARTVPGLKNKAISPHTFRHTTAMHLLQSGVVLTVIALWLGHEDPRTTHIYV